MKLRWTNFGSENNPAVKTDTVVAIAQIVNIVCKDPTLKQYVAFGPGSGYADLALKPKSIRKRRPFDKPGVIAERKLFNRLEINMFTGS